MIRILIKEKENLNDHFELNNKIKWSDYNMGLNLKPLITPKPIKISELNGKTLAVDAFNIIYQFLLQGIL